MFFRIQTLYMLVALLVTSCCLPQAIAAIQDTSAQEVALVYNLCMVQGEALSFAVCPLFILLLVPVCMAVVFLFNTTKRMLQAKLCLWGMGAYVAWYVCYLAYWWFDWSSKGSGVETKWTAWLPLVALIAMAMARRGVLADERLIWSADRIR